MPREVGNTLVDFCYLSFQTGIWIDSFVDCHLLELNLEILNCTLKCSLHSLFDGRYLV